MSKEQNKNDIIFELEKIAALRDDINKVKDAIDKTEAERDEQKQEILQNTLGDLASLKLECEAKTYPYAEKLPKHFKNSPPEIIPHHYPEIDLRSFFGDKLGRVSLSKGYVSILGSILAVICVVLAIGTVALMFTFEFDYWTLVLIALLFVAAAGCLFHFCPTSESYEWIEWYKKLKIYEREAAAWDKEFDAFYSSKYNEHFYNAHVEYDKVFKEMINTCESVQGEKIDKGLQDAQRSDDKYAEKIKLLEKELEGLDGELQKIDVIHPDLFAYAGEIADILKLHRADTLKEAINIALDDKRKRDEELARQEEARRQEEILEQQAWDMERHNLAMERAAEESAREARIHNQAMERAAQAQAEAAHAQAEAAHAQAEATRRQADAISRQNKMEREQSQAARRAAYERCGKCARRSKCSLHGAAAVNCTAFMPR